MSDQEHRLFRVCDTVATRIVQVNSPGRWAAARRLVEEYAAELAIDLSFQDFTNEIEDLPRHYGLTNGAFFLAEDPTGYSGGVGLRPFADGGGELKRLYVVRAARGRGIGRALAERVIDTARRLRYERLLLDTLASMHAANALYRSLGFKPTVPYRYNPLEGAAYFELKLE